MINHAVFLPPRECEHPYTISEINNGIASVIDSGNTLVWVEGEISTWRPSSSGHCYFRLKDSTSQIPAVLWRSAVQELDWRPADGAAVMAVATLRVYQRGGYYQLDIHRMQPLGQGALHAAFLKLKQRLEQEGLFDPSFKKKLPVSVRRIGIITSLTGAVLRDIVRVTTSRAPQTNLIVDAVAVQGDLAAKQIAAALRRFKRFGNVDCIIVARGGGSLEDLQAFNNETVARAIFESTIPVISAVGHETDFTIADFTADIRAATPSAAAEIAVNDTHDITRRFEDFLTRFRLASTRYFCGINSEYHRLSGHRSLKIAWQRLLDAEQRFDDLQYRLKESTYRYIEGRSRHVATAARHLAALSPLAVLSRGYSVVTNKSGTVIRDASSLHANEQIRLQFAKGEAEAEIQTRSSHGH